MSDILPSPGAGAPASNGRVRLSVPEAAGVALAALVVFLAGFATHYAFTDRFPESHLHLEILCGSQAQELSK